MDPGAVKRAIAQAVADAIPSLNCFGYVPDSVPEPCFYTGEVDIQFDRAMSRGMDELTINCKLLVSRSDDRSGQEALDEYLAGSGPKSVKAAMLLARGAAGEPALGGLADDVHLDRVEGYRQYEFGDGAYYYGAELVVRVYGRGVSP